MGSVSDIPGAANPLTSPLASGGNQIQWSKGADVASATALVLLTDGNYFDVTGTTTITSMNTTAVGNVVKIHFDGILTLTHDATNLILPGAANITTAAGDEAEFVEYASGNYRCTNYTKASGEPVVSAGGGALIYLSTVTASGVATADIETGFGSTYDNYVLLFEDLYPATTTKYLGMRLKIGGTYETADYTPTVDANGAFSALTSGGYIHLNGNATMANTASLSGRVELFDVNGDTQKQFALICAGTAGANARSSAVGYANGTGALTGVRFLESAGGNINGTFRLYGITKS